MTFGVRYALLYHSQVSTACKGDVHAGANRWCSCNDMLIVFGTWVTYRRLPHPTLDVKQCSLLQSMRHQIKSTEGFTASCRFSRAKLALSLNGSLLVCGDAEAVRIRCVPGA